MAFYYVIATMNLITIVIFFYKIYESIFNYLLIVKSSNSRFFGLISAYFGTIETNGQGILYPYYLVWYKEISSFSDLCKKIADKTRFKT